MKRYFLTFSNNSFKIQLHRIINEAISTGWFDKCISESEETIKSFINEHSEFFESNSRGFGCWIWKPYIILKWLNSIQDGDILVYQDAGGSVIKSKETRFNDYCEILKQTPLIVFTVRHYKEREFQKIDLLKKFNLETNQDFLDSGSIEAGVLILKKCDLVIKLCGEWLDLMLEDNYFFATQKTNYKQLDGFIDYREDQSILSILSKVNGIKQFDTESYGIGPFFSSRMSDFNLKADAPDKFLIRDDYDISRHFNYYHYQSDPEVRKNLELEVKKYFIELHNQLIFESVEHSLKTQFISSVVDFLDKTLYDFGLVSYTLSVDEDIPYTLIGRQILTGSIYLDIPAGYFIKLNFLFDLNGVKFHENEIERIGLFSKFKINKQRIIY